MKKTVAILLLVLLAAASAPAQEKNPDSQTLREILNELRLLRHDLQTTSVAAQRVQIVLYRLQLQDAAVARASRSVQEAQENLAQLVEQRQRINTQLKRIDDEDVSDPMRRQQYDEFRKNMKAELDRLGKEEEKWQGRGNDAEAKLRDEQSKLDGLHAILDELDQALADAGRNPAPSR